MESKLELTKFLSFLIILCRLEIYSSFETQKLIIHNFLYIIITCYKMKALVQGKNNPLNGKEIQLSRVLLLKAVVQFSVFS